MNTLAQSSLFNLSYDITTLQRYQPPGGKGAQMDFCISKVDIQDDGNVTEF